MAESSIKTEFNRKGDKRGLHPNSLKNLKPGQGRPRNELSITNCAREKLTEPCPYAPGQTWLEYLVDRWLGQAAQNPTYFKELIERLEGKIMQPLEAEIREVKDASDLTDEQLAVIAAKNILKNNAAGGRKRTSEEAGSKE